MNWWIVKIVSLNVVMFMSCFSQIRTSELNERKELKMEHNLPIMEIFFSSLESWIPAEPQKNASFFVFFRKKSGSPTPEAIWTTIFISCCWAWGWMMPSCSLQNIWPTRGKRKRRLGGSAVFQRFAAFKDGCASWYLPYHGGENVHMYINFFVLEPQFK